MPNLVKYGRNLGRMTAIWGRNFLENAFTKM